MPARARSFVAAAFGAALGFAAGAAATLAVGTVPADSGVVRADRPDPASRCPYLSGRTALPSASGETAPELRCPYGAGAGRGASAPGQVSPDAAILTGPGTKV